LNDYDQIIGRIVVISGVVSEDADTNQRGQLVLRLRDIHNGSDALPGMLWVTTSETPDIRRSDKVTLHGKLTEGFGSFAGSMYSVRIRTVERPVPGDVALQVRDYFASGVRAALSDTEASLGLGYLVGQRRGLPQDLNSALQAAGLMHIVVASGYNLTILVRLARRLFEKVSKYLSLLVSGAMIVGFIGITGLSPSMSRAGLIAGLSLLAWYYGRRFHPLVLLPFAMAITLLVQPAYAWGDLGWQLSFAAFAGVMILAPLLQTYFFGDKPERAFRRIFIETMAATVATLPILLVSFGQFSVVSPVANMLILPLVPLAMLLTFVGGIGGLVAPAAALIIGLPAQLLLTYMTGTAQLLGGIPWALQEAKLSLVAAMVAYMAMVIACVYMSWKTGYDLRRSSLVE
jgi:competence protein ComEC